MAMNDSNFSIHWIPSHCGITLNERADEEANQATNHNQDSTAISLSAATNLAKRTHIQLWRESSGSDWYKKICNRKPPPASITSLDRKHAVLVHQARTGKVTFSKKFLHSIGKATSPQCDLCNTIEDTEHILFNCAKYDHLRHRHNIYDFENTHNWSEFCDFLADVGSAQIDPVSI